MKYYEIQEFEAAVRSILAFPPFDLKEDFIDALIEDDVYLNEMKRRNDMNMMNTGAQSAEATEQTKAFESITKTLTKCKEIASHLSTRSEKLVSSFTGINEPPKEEPEKQKVDSVVLIHVLQDIEKELCQSLSEISDNLDKLEKAW